MELPLFDNVNGRHSDSTRNKAVSTSDRNSLEGTLDSIKDVVQDAWTELHREGLQEARKGM